ncbi:uncharacterized protein Z518_01005 [Rhinocladiella mackenziei CBS 650.93]|uniref:Rhinocladiella mackenziei CBS 650.93 unplaced genomic scaffold supercont1.1, whole genome shotgun sequence n=1 Tax=Rhinocladiella mackenziei CBS 650.93 TaxID=1442369 RepID=A0A0D2IV15_9EURO|nr:uncharacterized protein Z518_01005 [Rhinocladiella mackenziei CBS 650.93]KIX09924.1 hypothetical protein Z518_01005 [Rhinocladiella mackenziei CBS 650.93]
MASKFVVNAAFEARLLLRPPRQRGISPRTVLQLEYPTLQTLGSRSYSDSTSLKSAGSPEGSQSSGPKDKKWFSSETWDKVRGWGKALGLGAIGITFTGYVTQEMWKNWYEGFQRRAHESTRESAIYDQLKKGPIFRRAIKYTIPRKGLVEEIKDIVTPTEEDRLYSLIIGEHGTGKTSLIKLVVNGMDEPKGVVYVRIPNRCSLEVDVARAMQKSLGWGLDPLIDPSEPATLEEVLQTFSRLTTKYKQEYGRAPVLIVDNANRLAQKLPELLDLFQDYAKDAADEGTAVVVYVSSEGWVPRRMMGRSSWSRRGEIIEIGDVSKEEALHYLRLRNIDGEQAAQIYHLVGGRMIHLKFIADKLERNSLFEDTRQMMLNDAKGQLLDAEVLPKRRYHKEGAVIMRELLKKGSISWDAFYDLVDADAGDKLLEANIFAFHLNSQEITFQSTVMKRFCEENSALWQGN